MTDNVVSIGAAVDRAQKAPDMRRRKGKGGDDAPDEPAKMPPNSPVTVLGCEQSKVWILDRNSQLIGRDLRWSKQEIVLHFGNVPWLIKHFQRYQAPKKDGDSPIPLDDFDQQKVLQHMSLVAADAGIFNPQGRLFGRGAHRMPGDRKALVLHMGRQVMISNQKDHLNNRSPAPQVERAGAIGDAYFPAHQRLPVPADAASSEDEGDELLALLNRWFWVDPASPLILFGMAAQMFICGALDWRSHVWLVAPTASGKSELQALLRALQDAWCLGCSDPTAAAIRQVLGNDTLPVLIDEAEADDNPERQREILNLCKRASSGDKIIRGGNNHQGQEFTAQSCFLFSSVLHAPMKGEDRNRIAVLELLAVPDDAPPLAADWEGELERWGQIGRKMQRRMVNAWPRFAHVLDIYKREIRSQGFAGRWQDTYGTLLACADVMLFDVSPDEESPARDGYGRVQDWVRGILPLMWKSRSEAQDDKSRCIAHLMSQLIPGASGAAPETIGTWLQRAMTLKQDGQGVWVPNETARERLRSYGLRVVSLKAEGGYEGDARGDKEGWETGYLAVAYQTNTGLSGLFKGSEWANGVWTQSLGKIEGVKRPLKVRFAGLNSETALAIPLQVLKGED